MRKAFCVAFFAIALSLPCVRSAAAEETPGLQKSFGGLKGNVEVVIDKHGFPHIYAESEADAMFALGYMHARDRLWQMDFNRRAAEGRLSEIMGPDALDHDVFVRTIGLNRLARLSAKRAQNDPKLYANMTAYAWGVNSFIAEKMPDHLPVEFQRLGYQPEPWTPADSVAIGKAMAWELCGSLDDLYMGTLVQKLGWETVSQLFPVDRYKEIPIIPSEKSSAQSESGGEATMKSSAETGEGGLGDACLSIIRMASHRFRMLGDYDNIGSNNWVIDGTKSASDKPILASDPHLGFNMPCVWYVAHVKGGNLDAIGVSLPGVPMIVIGHNQHIAWGMTNTQADVTDFYVETLNEEKTQYLHEGEWKPLEVFNETIKVLGRDPVELKVAATAHGPILSTPQAELAIQWIGAEPDDDALAFSLLNRATDYDDFATAMQTLNAPPQNFDYADSNGMIAMWVAGLFPVRKAGFGRVPVDGASGKYDWTGFIPRIDTPHSVNPAQHYLASANQRPAPKDYPYYLGYEWDPGYRARRINRLLSSNDSITADMMKSFQADTYDMAAESMLPHLIAACKDEFEKDKPYANALDTLSKWDFLTTIDKAAPTIWWKWLDKFRNAVWEDEWQAAGIELPNDSWGFTDLNKWQPPLEVLERMVVEEPTSKWFDDVTTEERETLREIATRSLRQAVDELLQNLGEDMSKWNWGRVNRLRIDHLSGDPLLVRGGQPLNGSDLTLCARGTGGDVTGGPSWRMVVDFSDVGGAVGVFPGGQSGDPESPHYDDLIDKWVADEYVPLPFYSTPEQFSSEQVEARIHLSPSSEGVGLVTP